MLNKEIKIKDSNALILGFTFKENCPDVRNTKVIDIVNELNTYGVNVSIVDPHVDTKEVFGIYNINLSNTIHLEKKYDAIILAVGHDQFKTIELSQYLKETNVVFDVKGILDEKLIDGRL